MRKNVVLWCMLIMLFGFVAAAQADDKIITSDHNKVDRPSDGPSNGPSSSSPPNATPVPEPVTIALLAGGLVGLYGLKKKIGKD